MDAEKLKYRLVRSDRRTVVLQILPDGELLARCPRRMSAAAVDAFVQSKRAWIEKHMQNVANAGEVPVLTPEQLQKLSAEAKLAVGARVAFFAPQIGVTCGHITIRHQRTRWGSCSSKGNLNFNCLLMLAPPQVLDYVVIHELCHRKHLNHSAAFWAEMEKYCPDYRVLRRWLKENGAQLLARL